MDLEMFRKDIEKEDLRSRAAQLYSTREAQKEMFGTAVQYIPYVECDPAGNHANVAACKAENVESYPTWTFSNGERSNGVIQLRELEFRTGCTLPEETG